MGLVEYSDSEESASEQPVSPQLPSSAKPDSVATSSKASFQKVVDRSNPGKIRVNLPSVSNLNTTDLGVNGDEPPAKKPRLGGGGAFSGFNALLPAPRRPMQDNTRRLGGAKSTGLTPGVSLKTGATPAFSRSAAVEEYQQNVVEETGNTGSQDNSVDQPTMDYSMGSNGSSLPDEPAETKVIGKNTIFRPLSVARKPPKRKKPINPAAEQNNTMTAKTSAEAPEKPKLSLFSIGEDLSPSNQENLGQDSEPPKSRTKTTQLQAQDEDVEDNDLTQYNTISAESAATQISQNRPQSLDSIADDLNLSESARRQLFGRQGRSKAPKDGTSAIKIVNFNTDAEYAANEAARAAGEAVVHNPVRAIAPGKHSLKQLVNSATSQIDALEEQFATGKRNKREAGSRYGW